MRLTGGRYRWVPPCPRRGRRPDPGHGAGGVRAGLTGDRAAPHTAPTSALTRARSPRSCHGGPEDQHQAEGQRGRDRHMARRVVEDGRRRRRYPLGAWAAAGAGGAGGSGCRGAAPPLAGALTPPAGPAPRWPGRPSRLAALGGPLSVASCSNSPESFPWTSITLRAVPSSPSSCSTRLRSRAASRATQVGRRPARGRAQRLQRDRGALLAPLGDQRGVQALAAQQRPPCRPCPAARTRPGSRP